MKQVVTTIAANGKVDVEATGFENNSCLTATARLHDALFTAGADDIVLKDEGHIQAQPERVAQTRTH